jgi:hypothetical protein
LGTVRFLGTFLSDPTDVPAEVVDYVSEQVGAADASCLNGYLGRFEHTAEIIAAYGYRDFAAAEAELVPWLDDRGGRRGTSRRSPLTPSSKTSRSRSQRTAPSNRLRMEVAMAKRSYGSGRLFVVTDKAGKESWYGSWYAGGVRIKRKIGDKRPPGSTHGLTRVQAERELRRRVEKDVIVATAARRTLEAAGEQYVDHLEHVMDRKRSTIQDYRGYLRRHLVPFFGDRAIDRIDALRVAAYLKRKRADGLSSKTVQTT